MTPEGKVKKQVDAILAEFDVINAKEAGRDDKQHAGWYFKPGQNGYGVKGVPDYIGHFKGQFFGIETKAPGKEPSGFQALQIKAILATDGAVFVVDGEEGLTQLKKFFSKQKTRNANNK